MAAVGNLNDYVKFQMAQGMTTPGASGAAGFATEMAVGMAMAQQIVQQQGGGVLAPPPVVTPPGVPPPLPTQTPPEHTTLTLLSPGDVANQLGVSEGDVLATIEAGDLKAKKIGSTWRITKAALDEFLKS
jgi:excisionase family DNA binding protein